MKCPRCNVNNCRTRIKTQQGVCNSCGFIWVLVQPGSAKPISTEGNIGNAEVPHDHKGGIDSAFNF